MEAFLVKHVALVLFLSSLLVSSSFAQPAVATGGVVNAASYSLPGLPNSFIAQGSMFLVFGTSLGTTSNLSALQFPLPISLLGTSIQVTVGSSTPVNAIMVYTTPTQVAAILPSNAPVGAGRLTLTFNGQSSSTDVTVVRSSFGIFTVNQAGSGPSIAQNVISGTDQPLNGVFRPARPGQTVILWGTGLGPVSGDETAGPLPGDLKDTLGVEVFVGNRPARVVYAGRSGCCAGLDQVVFEVPDGVEGCYVIVTVRVGGASGVVSNFTSMAVSASGNVCSDPNGISTTDLMSAAAGTLRIGVIDLSRTQIQLSLGASSITSTADTAASLFGRYSTQQLGGSRGITQSPSIGSCAVSTFRGLNPTPVDPIRPVPFDAGAALSITGPMGNKTIPRAVPGVYAATLGGASLDQLLSGGGAPEYLVAGDYTVSGTGGPGGDASVGSFQAQIRIPTAVVWTNAAQVTAINRSQDLEITWSGGDPNGFVAISAVGIATGPAGPDANSPGAAVLCLERTSAGRFRVPSFVLQALPASPPNSILPSGFMLVGATGVPVRFSAPNLDAGYLTFRTLSGKGVSVR
jgi:uncharacterized protein (TIGR03437 family)